MKFIRSKSCIILILTILLIFNNINSHYKIKDLERIKASFIQKTDVTFMYLLTNEDSTLLMAQKLEQLSKSKDWNEMNLLLGELSFIRGDWVESHQNIIHQTNTTESTLEETGAVNEFTLLGKEGKQLWHQFFGIWADLSNVSLYVKQPNKPDFEKTKALFARLSKELYSYNEELEVIKSQENTVNFRDLENVQYLKEDYLKTTSPHIAKIKNDLDEFLATRYK
jgi:hypothetical protein